MKHIPAANWLLIFASIVLMLGLAELVLHLFPVLAGQHHERKGFIHTTLGLGACYTSNPHNYFPYDLTQKEDKKSLDAILKNKNINDVAEQTPYCIVHNEQQRRSGLNPQREHSIAIVGDSFTYGEGVRDEHTLGAYLGKKTQYNVRNYGQSGATINWIGGQIEQAMRETDDLEAVVYFYNLNDVLLSKSVESRRKYIIDFQNVNWAYLGQPQKDSWSDILSSSLLFRLANNAYRMHHESNLTIDNYLEMYLSKDNEKELKQTFDIIEQLRKKVEERGARFIMVIYPLLYKQLSGEYPFQPAHQVIMDQCSVNSMQCIDGAEAFSDISNLKSYTVHPIDFHPNAKANETMASFLSEKIMTGRRQ